MNEAALSIVVVGAHVDDHWFGMGGTMLKAARAGHRVTVLQGVSVYGSWPTLGGRGPEVSAVVSRLTDATGIRVVPLGHDYLRLVNGPELIGQLAEEIARLDADLIFCPWEDDYNEDHVVMGQAARIAAKHGRTFLSPDRTVKLPAQVVQYWLDTRARSFRPDSYVDIGDGLFELLELTNEFNELYDRSPSWGPGTLRRISVTDHVGADRTVTLHSQGEYMFARSLYFGSQCGARFADGFATYNPVPADRSFVARI